jgi:uncharacterized RDD family membrane protein YckC/DNA-binding transcriptional ArsR family regulator
MATDQDNVSKILAALSNPLRREILLYLSDKEECTFTDLMNALRVDTGKLSFHIHNLEAFLDQTPTGKYKLSKVGRNALVLVRDLEAWAVEATIAARPSTLPLASFKKRTAAFLIDLGIAFVLFFALPNIFYPITMGNVLLSVNIIFFLALFWIYLTLLEGFAGQTLGKRVAGLRVVRTDGKNVSYDHAAVRNFGKVFLLPFDLIVGLRIKDKRFIRYFDKFAGTTVVDLRVPSSPDDINSSLQHVEQN